MVSGLNYLRRRGDLSWEISVDRLAWNTFSARSPAEALATASKMEDCLLVAVIGPELRRSPLTTTLEDLGPLSRSQSAIRSSEAISVVAVEGRRMLGSDWHSNLRRIILNE